MSDPLPPADEAAAQLIVDCIVGKTCDHQWFLYDVYCVNPHFGNWRCERCGKRRKGASLTDEQVTAYLARNT